MVIAVDFQTKQFNIEILDILISYDQLLQSWICSSNFQKYLWDFHEDQKINVAETAETRWEESFDGTIEVSWTETCRDTIWWGWLRKRGTGDK